MRESTPLISLTLAAIALGGMMGVFPLCSVSCVGNSGNSPRLTSYSSLEMANRGNCLPFALSGVVVESTIHISPSAIRSLCMTSPRQVFALNDDGEILSYDPQSKIVSRTYKVEGAEWGFACANSNGFLLCGAMQGWHLANEDPKLRSLICFDSSGRKNWEIRDFRGGAPILSDDDYVVTRNLEGEWLEICSLRAGRLRRMVSGDYSPVAALYFLRGESGLIGLGFEQGPLLITRADGRYEIQQWNDAWDSGFFRATLDAKGRLCGLSPDPLGLVILGQGQSKPVTVPYVELLGLPVVELYESPGPELVASNGDTIIVRYSDNLLRYRDGAIELWWKDLAQYTDDDVISSLYIDSTASKAILPMDHSVLLIGDDVEEIDFEGTASTSCLFTETMDRALIGTEEGDLVTLRLIRKPD